MRLSDEAIVDGVTRYRESVGGRHGPPALTYLARYLKSEGLVEEEPSKALLSIRIRKLVDQSGARFAIPKSEARRLVEVERPKLLDSLQSSIPASLGDDDVPGFWGE